MSPKVRKSWGGLNPRTRIHTGKKSGYKRAAWKAENRKELVMR